MSVLDVLNGPWAITPDKLGEIQGIYLAHLRGDSIDLSAVEARIGREVKNDRRPYVVQNGVALISMYGVVAKRMNLFSQISGGTSSEQMRSEIQAALDDKEVKSIILQIDSPGGSVDGTQLLADAVTNANKQKPVYTWATGCMASAAYWVGSAARGVYIADSTTEVGSIGVVTSHVDVSAAESARGVKTTEITAGKFKRIDSQYAPLSQDGQQYIQGRVDYLYSLFVEAVAKNRGMTADQVLSDMADGRVFTGQQAIDAGLVDGIMPLDSLIEKVGSGKPSKPTGARMSTEKMTAEAIAEQHPEAAAALRSQGADAERSRIQGVEAQALPGYEALIEKMKFDGKSTGGDAAQAVLAEERKRRANAASDAVLDAPKPVVTSQTADPASNDKPVEKSKDQLVKDAKDHMAKTGEKDFLAAYKAVGGK